MTNLENPYLDNQNTWNEINGREKANTAIWRMFALLQIGVTALAVGGMIYLAQLPRKIPVLFKEDAFGGVTLLGVPNQVLKVDNQVIANQLAIFIQGLRQVPNSDEMRRRYVRQVKMMSLPALFSSQLAKMIREEYKEIGSGELLIEIKTIIPVAKNTWEIEWLETRNGVGAGKFKATLSYVQNPEPAMNPEELLWNFSGLLVKEININRVIGS